MSHDTDELTSLKIHGTVLIQSNRLEEAKKLFTYVIKRDENDADAWYSLSSINGMLGNMVEAGECCRRVIDLRPDHFDAHLNLGNVLLLQGKHNEAIESYQRALASKPDYADAYNNVGIALSELGSLDKAVINYRHAIQLNPTFAAAYNNLGNALKAQGLTEQAVVNYQRAVELNSGYAKAYENLARAMLQLGRDEEAVLIYKQWLAVDPGNPTALHLLAACEKTEIPTRASDDYLRQTFDDFANEFEKTLNRVDYRGPSLFAESIEKIMGQPAGSLDVLDAGCGTGLCGPGVRPYARRLVGVDISTGMLARASERGLYDELVAAELTAFLTGLNKEFDLIISADTLNYFGALEALFIGMAQALRTNGRLVFTAEQADPEEAPDGFCLHSHGRYSHSEEYINRSLFKAGLAIDSLSKDILRYEWGKPVPCLVVTAKFADSVTG